MQALKTKRCLLKGSITRIWTFISRKGAEASVSEWECRMGHLEEVWHQYVAIANAMLEECDDDNKKVEIEEDFEACEDQVLVAKGKLRQHIADHSSVIAVAAGGANEASPDQVTIGNILSSQTEILNRLARQASSSTNSFLPKLKIRSFDGNLTEWKSFHDSFVSAIHSNSNYTACQKFQLLKSYLIDQPYNIIGHIPESNENYVEAWNKLCNRYNKLGVIASTHVSKFLNMHIVNTQSAVNLRKLYDTADETIRGLRALGEQAEKRDVWLVHILVSKLDTATTQEWTKFNKSSNDFPTLAEFLEFLNITCDALESATTTTTARLGTRSQVVKSHQTTVGNGRSCAKCNNAHDLAQCRDFTELNTKGRREFVANKRICYNCLRVGHVSSNCRSKHSCRNCGRRHHSLLHEEENERTSQTRKTETDVSVNCNALPKISTLLPTAVCNVRDSYGEQQQCRLLIDSGSEKTIISESCVQRLGLQRRHARIPISGLSGAHTGISHGWVSLHIESRLNSETIDVDALIMPTIASSIPARQLPKEHYNNFLSLELADPLFYRPAQVDILLGMEKVFDIFRGDKINGNDNMLTAISTSLGWIVGGDFSFKAEKSPSIFFSNIDIDQALAKFWETEEIACPIQLTDDELKAEKSFAEKHNRMSDGKFSVELPFKSQFNDFGNSYELALKRLMATERRLDSNVELKTQYIKFMADYIALNHMEKIPDADITRLGSECFYLPHHPVLKNDSTTTRLRVVFDGSIHSSNCSSLNEALLVGPPLLRELFAVVLRFRRHRFVMSADVEKMYRMIWVHEYHRDFQRVLWRTGSRQPVEHYRLKTVTYGTACAPFLAVRVLEELGRTSLDEYPEAAQVLLNEFYMDDVMTGSESVDQLLDLHHQLVQLLRGAGMNLRKWTSNCSELLSALPPNLQEISSINRDSKWLKLLGLKWNPSTDVFGFGVSFSNSEIITKQAILSDAARIFDPLGFVTPCTILIKILFQELWLLQLDWKDEVPSEVAERWLKLKGTLTKINDLQIPRRGFFANGKNELHGFCDASQNAYAAVVYCRSEYEGKITTQLLAAKSRVAPLKQVSLPRLELCGALLLCRLMNSVIKALEVEKTNVYMWTDSSVVLHWLSSIPRRWSIYIANRTSEILSNYGRSQWNHVRSAHNAADPASRGVWPSSLQDLSIWWNGPEWLCLEKKLWPKSADMTEISHEQSEERKNQSILHINNFLVSAENHVIVGTILQRTSQWSRLVRSTAYCLRFIGLLRKNNYSAHLSSNELQDAINMILQITQQELFADELLLIKQNKFVKKGKLATLCPFVDDTGILRVGGRIKNSSASFTIKHPVILSSNHYVTELLVKYTHLQYLHVGVSHLIFILRQQYWILGARNIARRTVRTCVQCFKLRKTTQTQLMGDLPMERVRFQRPFSKVGCDYAGPFSLKVKAGRVPRKVKGYIALFVCFVTKAIHIELVGDLTSEAFIGSLDRFISRRGKPSEIWSDNATNLVGAQRKLEEIEQIVQKQQRESNVANYFAQNGISWRFIPPSSPHFGGLWEAGVKSIKTHLKRVIGETSLTYESLYTVLTRIEALLNSRPLCPSNDGEIDALTPAHFLIGQPLTARPEVPFEVTTNLNPLRQWDKVKHMAQGFWNRWHAEYLTSLQQRQRWRIAQPSLKLHDIVILRETNVPQSQWTLARVVKLHPIADGKVRIVTVKTAKGEYMRPITKLALLPSSVGPQSSSGGEDV